MPVYLRSDQPENANAPPPRLLVESSAFSPFASTANADDGDARNCDEKLQLFGGMARNKLGLVVSGRGLDPVPVCLRMDEYKP